VTGGAVGADQTVVETAAGRIRGEAAGDLLVWRGIRYAEAPAGALRFRPPQPVRPWSGVRAAIEPGPVAWQSDLLPIAGARQTLQRSEDCLLVNVTRPVAPPPGPRGYPVLVWIHGGGYSAGSGADEITGDGAVLARHGVVVVTFNYRLGSLGFLHLADVAGGGFETAGQAGFLDQVAALRWVRENISGFGGDPGRVTVHGVSAGAKSIASLLASPLAAGLLTRAISASGGAEHLATPQQGARLRRRLLGELGLPDDEAGVRRLPDVPAAELILAQDAIASGGRGTWVWRPVLGSPGIPVLPIEAITAGAGAGVPMLIGHNGNEGATYQLMDPSAAEQAPRVLTEAFGAAKADAMLAAYAAVRPELDETGIRVAVLGDERYGVPTHRLALAQAAHAPVWRYRYDTRPPGYPPEWDGGHGLDSIAVWRDDDFVRAALSGRAQAQARLGLAMAAAFARFARGAEPSPGEAGDPLPRWEPFDAAGGVTLILDDAPHAERHPRAAEFAIWGDAAWPSGTWWPVSGL